MTETRKAVRRLQGFFASATAFRVYSSIRVRKSSLFRFVVRVAAECALALEMP
jgi:hypothetical protein